MISRKLCWVTIALHALLSAATVWADCGGGGDGPGDGLGRIVDLSQRGRVDRKQLKSAVATDEMTRRSALLHVTIDFGRRPKGSPDRLVKGEVHVQEVGGNGIPQVSQLERVNRFKVELGKKYCISVAAEGGEWVAPSRIVRVESPRMTVSVQFGRNGDYFMARGTRLVPMEKRPLRLYLVFGEQSRTEAQTIALREVLRAWGRQFGEEDIDVRPLEGRGESISDFKDGTVWRIRLPQANVDYDKLLEGLVAMLPAGVSVGTDMSGSEANAGEEPPNLIHIGRYTIRLPAAGMTPEDFNRMLRSSGGKLLRYLTDDRRLLYVEFSSSRPPYVQVEQLQEWQRNGVLENWDAEPAGVALDDQIPQGWPNDPDYETHQVQGLHGVQGVRAAWEVLANVENNGAVWVVPESVVVGSIDAGVDTTHAEIALCTTATSQFVVAECFDMNAHARCNVRHGHCLDVPAGQDIPNMHGMMVFSVISACTNNGTELAGIAPGAKHVIVKKHRLIEKGFSMVYADMVLWMAGLAPTCLAAGDDDSPIPGGCEWPPPPGPSDAARVINISQRMPFDLTDYWKNVLERLETAGAGQKGVLLVISAGNEGNMIAQGSLLQHPYVVTVANCVRSQIQDGGPAPHNFVERLARLPSGWSNYGEGTDLCALGEGAVTLRQGCLSHNGTGTKPCDRFGGTSAAAATVTGVAALVLGAYQDATSSDLRDLLRCGATQTFLDYTDKEGTCAKDETGVSLCYGWGRVDAENSVLRALELKESRRSNPSALACTR